MKEQQRRIKLLLQLPLRSRLWMEKPGFRDFPPPFPRRQLLASLLGLRVLGLVRFSFDIIFMQSLLLSL